MTCHWHLLSHTRRHASEWQGLYSHSFSTCPSWLHSSLADARDGQLLGWRHWWGHQDTLGASKERSTFYMASNAAFRRVRELVWQWKVAKTPKAQQEKAGMGQARGKKCWKDFGRYLQDQCSPSNWISVWFISQKFLRISANYRQTWLISSDSVKKLDQPYLVKPLASHRDRQRLYHDTVLALHPFPSLAVQHIDCEGNPAFF